MQAILPGPNPTKVSELVDEAAQDFRVDSRIYTDPAIFDLEMDRIFGTTWVYVAHESELPDPGDFVTSFIGTQPIIVSRAADGTVHVMFNRCRHRGAVVCRHRQGHAATLACVYHGWAYDSTGALVSISQQEGGYPADLDKSQFSLLKPARMEIYRGLIFASLNAGVPSLKDYLGEARRYIDLQFDRSPSGEIDLRHGTHRCEYRGNWKFIAENSMDGYHANTVHTSFWTLVAKFGNSGGQHGSYSDRSLSSIRKRRDTGWTQSFPHGHCLMAVPLAPEVAEAIRGGPFQEYCASLERKHGAGQLDALMSNYYVLIFPNVAIMFDQIRTIRPIAIDRTEVNFQPFALKGVPEEYNHERFNGYQRFFGPSAFGSPDDIEIFARCQSGLAAREVRWISFARGLGRERTNKDMRIGAATDETPQRGFHRGWKQLMST